MLRACSLKKQLPSFCSSKEMVSKLKRIPTEWEKIFANYTSKD
jgi:hypothetical protein